MSSSRLRESVRGHFRPENQRRGLYHGAGQQWDSLRRDADIFSGQTELDREEAAATAASEANAAAASQRAREMVAQMFGGAYAGGDVSGGGGSGMLASPMMVTPQQQPNQGLPMLQNQGSASRGDIASFLAQMRQQMPNTGYNPLLPRTVMPPPQQAPAAPAGMPLGSRVESPPQMGLSGGSMQDWYAQLMRSSK